MTSGAGACCRCPSRGEVIKSLPEYLAVGIGLDQQFVACAGHIHKAAVRCLATELRLGLATDDALIGSPHDEQRAMETTGEPGGAQAVNRVERRIQPPIGHPPDRQVRIGREIGKTALKTLWIAGKGIVFKNAVPVRVALSAGSEGLAETEANRRADETAQQPPGCGWQFDIDHGRGQNGAGEQMPVIPQETQTDVRPHRVGHENERWLGAAAVHAIDEPPEVLQVVPEPAHVALEPVRGQAAGEPLPPPVHAVNAPAAPTKIGSRFNIFLQVFGAAVKQNDGAAGI